MGSGIAAELGLAAIVGSGSAATRVINWSHWVALSALVLRIGAGAVRPAAAECAALAVVAGSVYRPGRVSGRAVRVRVRVAVVFRLEGRDAGP